MEIRNHKPLGIAKYVVNVLVHWIGCLGSVAQRYVDINKVGKPSNYRPMGKIHKSKSANDMNNDTVIILCSTLGSKRIPQKAIKPVNGVPMIIHLLNRIKELPFPIILAIPDSNKDFVTYSNILKENSFPPEKIFIWLGNDDSPLHRMSSYLEWANKDNVYKYVIRITHDDIIIDAKTILDMLAECRKGGYGYAISPTIIEGAGVEIIEINNIVYAAKKYTQPVEHISWFVKGDSCPNPTILRFKPRNTIERDYRLTVDYPEDLIATEAIFGGVGNDVTTDAICNYVDSNPAIMEYNKQPEVTIYTCVNNGGQFIGRTVESVLSNRYDNYEYIIVDDYSTDNTLAEILKIRGNNKIKIIQNETNLGLASSSNIALKNARGKYIMRIDADDRIFPYAITKMIEKIKDDRSVIVYPNYHEIDNDDKLLNLDLSGLINHHAGGALMEKRLINELKFKEGLRHWDSIQLFNRLNHHFKISYIEQPLFFYRRHDKNISQNNLEERAKIYKQINNEV